MNCIYQLRNKRTNKIYYGSTTDFHKRYSSIEYDWAKHRNRHVREDALAGDEFYYELIADSYVTREAAYSAEQAIFDFFIETGQWDTIYNISDCATDAKRFIGWNTGLTKETHSGLATISKKLKGNQHLKGNIPWNKSLTKETHQSVAAISKKRMGHAAWNKGLTKETNSRISAGAKKRCGENSGKTSIIADQVTEMRNSDLKFKSKTARAKYWAKKYNMSPSGIYHILEGDTWKHLI